MLAACDPAFLTPRDAFGRQSELAPATLRINELSCKGDDWVELVNPTNERINANGFRLASSAIDTVELSAALDPGETLVVNLEGAGFPCSQPAVQLLDARGDVVDSQELPPLRDGQTWARVPDGTGKFDISVPTPRAPNARFGDDNDPQKRLFSPERGPVTIQLTLEAAAVASLRAEGANFDSRTYVPGTFQLIDEDGESEPHVIGVRLKGKFGSARSFDQKPALKIDFKRFEGGSLFRGLEELALNNQVQDPTRTREWLTYRVMREAGLFAPRMTYAHLFVNGLDYGLYNLLEARDDPWYAQHYSATTHVYEGEFTGVPGGQDLRPENLNALDIDEGDDADRADLQRLITAIDQAPANAFFDTLDPLVDWDQILQLMAAEVLVAHWDGYTMSANNYYVHMDGASVATILPWGTDQTWQENEPGNPGRPFFANPTRLFRGCINDPKCVAGYENALRSVSAAAGAADLQGDGLAIAARIKLLAAEDPRAEFRPPLEDSQGGSVTSELLRSLDLLRRHRATVARDVGCFRDPNAVPCALP